MKSHSRPWRSERGSLALILFVLLFALSTLSVFAESNLARICPDGQILVDGTCVRELGEQGPLDVDIDIDLEQTPDIDIDPGDIVLTPVGTQEPTPTPIVIDIEQPADQPSVTATFDLPPDVDVIPRDETTGKVTIHKYDCGADQSVYEMPLGELRDICEPMPAVSFAAANEIGGIPQEGPMQSSTDGNGFVFFEIPNAESVTVTEFLPASYTQPMAACGLVVDGEPAPGVLQVLPGGSITLSFSGDQKYSCNWFNVQADSTGTIEILKYGCDTDPGDIVVADASTLDDCESLDGIEFTVYGESDSFAAVTGDTGQGAVRWTNLSPYPYVAQESLPAGYGEPVVSCVRWYGDLPSDFFQPPVEDASVVLDLDHDMTIRCIWINLPLDDASITIYKHTCPPGYDLYASGADPYLDCTSPGNGIGFWLNGDDPQWTGDYLDSAVVWSDLAPGAYSVTEDVPSQTKTVFVRSCQGNSTPLIQNHPVSIGPEFLLYVESGDQIVCDWYNVPEDEHATITVVKYACSTKTFVSSDYCQLYEGGAGFDLSKHDGSNWTYVASGDTNASGVLVFGGLRNGRYQIDEIDGPWCYATADRTDAQGYLLVDNHDVTVWVYNCGIDLPKPKPGAYPNTGVGTAAEQPAIAAAPVIPAEPMAVLDWRQWAGVFDSRLIAPFVNGGKPAKIDIEGIGVSAAIETLEIVDGTFQEPTTAEQVAWYKDTSWLDEPGNIVIAGHLNYWGVPEGVFFALDTIVPGAIVEITAENGTVYRYEVTTVDLLPADSASLEAVMAETGGEVLTLITCGGDWDSSSQHYLHRTVVQATRIA